MHLGEMLISHASGKKSFGTIEFMAFLIYYAHENYCLGFDEVPKVSRGEVFTFLEDNNNDINLANELQKVLVAYNESKPAQQINEVNEAVAAKKKLATKKSVSSRLA